MCLPPLLCQEEQVQFDAILAKRKKRGKKTEEKPVEEKTTLHSKCTWYADIPLSLFSEYTLYAERPVFIYFFQSRIPWIIKVALSSTPLKM